MKDQYAIDQYAIGYTCKKCGSLFWNYEKCCGKIPDVFHYELRGNLKTDGIQWWEKIIPNTLEDELFEIEI